MFRGKASPPFSGCGVQEDWKEELFLVCIDCEDGGSDLLRNVRTLPFYMASYSRRLQRHIFYAIAYGCWVNDVCWVYATWFQTTELRRNVRNVFVSERKKFETIVFSKVFTLRSLVLVACTIRGISGRDLAARPFRCMSVVLQSVFVRTYLQCTHRHTFVFLFYRL